MTEVHKPRQKYYLSFLTGGIAGICGKTSVAPIERIKMLFVTRARKFRFAYAFKEAKYVFQTHGIFNFWRGNSAFCLRVFPFAAINFSVYDRMRKTFYHPMDQKKNILRKFALFSCGAVSGLTATSVCYPCDVLWISLAMQKDHFKYANIFDGIYKIFKYDGVKAFYKGIQVALTGVVIYHGTGFYIATTIKEHFLNNYKDISKKWYADFASGSIGTICGQFMGYPFDIVRKRFQAQALLLKTQEIKIRRNIGQLVSMILQEEGFRKGFYKGFSLNLIKGPTSGGIIWTVKNFLNRTIDKHFDF